MKIPERHFLVTEAKLDLAKAVLGVFERYQLTYHEWVSLFLEQAQAMTRDGMRHDAQMASGRSKKGDEA